MRADMQFELQKLQWRNLFKRRWY